MTPNAMVTSKPTHDLTKDPVTWLWLTTMWHVVMTQLGIILEILRSLRPEARVTRLLTHKSHDCVWHISREMWLTRAEVLDDSHSFLINLTCVKVRVLGVNQRINSRRPQNNIWSTRWASSYFSGFRLPKTLQHMSERFTKWKLQKPLQAQHSFDSRGYAQVVMPRALPHDWGWTKRLVFCKIPRCHWGWLQFWSSLQTLEPRLWIEDLMGWTSSVPVRSKFACPDRLQECTTVLW